MKRLTINRIAGAGLKANRRGYRSLAVGIFLSIFLISSLCLCVQGVFLAQREKQVKKLGYTECFILNDRTTDENLKSTGFFEQIGHIYVTGCITDSRKYLGYYDEAGAALMNRQLREGRLPEKAGEIALELSVLESLRLEAKVGDQVTWSVTPIDGVSEERTFTLVGILSEQNCYLDASNNAFSSEGTMALPALLVSREEPAFATGRLVTHYALTLSPMTSSLQVCDYADNHAEWFLVGVSSTGITFGTWSKALSNLETSMMMTPLYLLIAALIVSVCIGISGAMEGQLARKTQEIGMLRAVGATRAQIRHIFGREAWLLALLLTPLAMAAGCLFSWMLAKAAPDEFIFKPTLFIILPIAALSMLCILMSSNMPLRRASRIMPMSVLRDTSLLRKSKFIHSKSQFRVQRLISWRQNRLHPTRQLGSALLVALMLFCATLCTFAARESLQGLGTDECDLEINSNFTTYMGSFYQDMSGRAVTTQDINQIAALSGVERVETTRDLVVNLVLDEIPDFFPSYEYSGADMTHYLPEEDYLELMQKWDTGSNPDSLNYDRQRSQDAQVEYAAMRDALGIDGKMVINHTLRLCVIDPDALAPFVEAGKIDLAALNAGREVLAYAPDIYESAGRGDNTLIAFEEPKDRPVSRFIKNDSFSAGQTLSLIQLAIFDNDSQFIFWSNEGYDLWYQHYKEDIARADATVTVGAVLKGDIDDVMGQYCSPCLLTTEKGAEALGLFTNTLDRAKIYLSDFDDEQAEEQLIERIENIAMRGDNTRVTNNREYAQEHADYLHRMIMVLSSIIALFFVVSVSMITGGITRRIRADARLIGTLRAVGADARVITGCYSTQIALSVLAGLVLGAISCLFLWRSMRVAPFEPLSVLVMLLFSALCYLCCWLVLRLRIRETMSRSIVENIREL